MADSSSPILRGDLDTPRPLRAKHGKILMTGWCLVSGIAEPPAVRLALAGHFIAGLSTPRTDVVVLMPGEPASLRCGFQVEGLLPPGVHAARLEAQLPDGAWAAFKSFTVAAEARPFTAALEAPVTTEPVRERVHVEGWALAPDQPLRTLSLRYGHQEIPCTLDRPRSDLPALFPDSPHAARAGFKSSTILSAGRGRLRLRAELAGGASAVATTSLWIDVPTDENHDARLNFGATAVGLARAKPRLPAPPAPSDRKRLNILFVLPGSFASNSALHVAALANELSRAGHACAIAVPHDLETICHLAAPLFRGVLYQNVMSTELFPNRQGPDVIHAWTTRENVRVLCTAVRARHPARLVVHLEDNEQEILALALGRPAGQLAGLADTELASLVPPDLSNPRRAHAFLECADGITVITEKLREFVPTGRPSHLVQPAADERYFLPQPRPDEFRRLLDRQRNETVLFYHGNVHTANAAEVRALYAAVWQLNQAGEPVTLVRTGLDRVDFLGDLASAVAPHILPLGQILHHRHLPPLMALADIFVQPGVPDAFNDYRFPSKLPEFFALGRPVVLPRTNLGTRVRHGIDAYVLDRADADGIAGAVSELRRDRALYARLSEGAVAFAEKNFSWRRSAEGLASFYASLTRSPLS